jgi:hypothetical protein
MRDLLYDITVDCLSSVNIQVRRIGNFYRLRLHVKSSTRDYPERLNRR